MQKIFTFLFISVLFTACVKDKPDELLQPALQLSNSKKVYVVNEGNYGSGNASVTLFDPAANQSIEDFYSTQNGSSPGDVAQSLSSINNSFYLVMNNSKKIIICDEQFKKTGQINGLDSPRYILAVTNQKAYVSDLYANGISVVDLNSKLKIGTIPCPGKTEKMVMIYDKVFVTNTERAYVYIINAALDRVEDSIYVAFGASSVVVDRNDKIWVLASGNQSNSTARLSKISALTLKVETFFEFEGQVSPWNLCLNKGKDTLYYLNEHIFRMAVSEMNLPQTPIVQRGTKNFYGLGIHPLNHSIYASDAMDYSQRSNIYIYDHNGTQLNLFKAGINANSFYFE